MSRRSLSSAAMTLLLAALLPAGAAWPLDADELSGFERTPPRLAFSDGEVSFWRSGADEWAPARVNTPLAAGDELFTGDESNLELQVGAGAFVRAGAETQFGLTGLEPDFLQLRLTTGRLSLDLRSRRTSQTLEIDTPNAAFTIEHNGYYRVEVDGDTTTFTSRRGGRATVTPASGEPAAIAPSEQLVVTGSDAPDVETWAAPELDAWDRWNYERTDDQMDAVSARYVPAGVSGVDDLDHHGDWRVVPTYGAVWVPRRVAAGWVPYSTGRWIYDPFYGWTWVDDAPWGWAPYHYGRWVHVSGHWGWCPGRVVVRPYYAPALVAFYGRGFSLGISTGPLGWVALGWGEPLVPWWGPTRFRAYPRWAGWGGPRFVNDVVVKHETVIHVNEINVYRNARVHHAIVGIDRDHFGRRSRHEAKFARFDAGKLSPLHGDLRVKPDRTSLVAATGPARRPPRDVLHRAVVATREPRVHRAFDDERRGAERSAAARARDAERDLPLAEPPVRMVQPPRSGRRISVSERAPFGRGGEAERRIPPPTPRFSDAEREEGSEARAAGHAGDERGALERGGVDRGAERGAERREARDRERRAERAEPVRPAIDPDAGQRPRAGVGGERTSDRPRVEPRSLEPRGQRRAERGPEPRVERGLEARVERPAEPRVEPRVEPHVERPAEPRLEPRRGRIDVDRSSPGRWAPRHAEPPPEARALPGEPANRVYRNRPERRGGAAALDPRAASPQPGAPQVAPPAAVPHELEAPRGSGRGPRGRDGARQR